METPIEVKLTFEKEDLICCVCRGSLTGQIFQCVNGPHLMCGKCNSTYIKKECPVCKHPEKLVRNLLFENSLKSHLQPCQNNGCTEKFFKWDTEHNCLFAPVQCKICKREVAGNITQYSLHLEEYCDENFKSLHVNKFEKRIQYNPNSHSAVLKISRNILLVIRKNGLTYEIFALKNPDVDFVEYKRIICSYIVSDIEYRVYIPITNLNNQKIAEIHTSTDENVNFIFSKDIEPSIQQTQPQTQQRLTPQDTSFFLPPLFPFQEHTTTVRSLPSGMNNTIHPLPNYNVIENIFNSAFNNENTYQG